MTMSWNDPIVWTVCQPFTAFPVSVDFIRKWYKWTVMNFVTVHSRHSQKRIFDAFRCFAALFAHKMALPLYPSEFRFSCKHGIWTQKDTSELWHKKRNEQTALANAVRFSFPFLYYMIFKMSGQKVQTLMPDWWILQHTWIRCGFQKWCSFQSSSITWISR